MYNVARQLIIFINFIFLFIYNLRKRVFGYLGYNVNNQHFNPLQSQFCNLFLKYTATFYENRKLYTTGNCHVVY